MRAGPPFLNRGTSLALFLICQGKYQLKSIDLSSTHELFLKLISQLILLQYFPLYFEMKKRWKLFLIIKRVRAAERVFLYSESTTLITDIEATGVQLKPETYIEWSIA